MNARKITNEECDVIFGGLMGVMVGALLVIVTLKPTEPRPVKGCISTTGKDAVIVVCERGER